MLDVVDAQTGSLAKADGAEMAGDSQPSVVRGADRRAQLRCSQAGIRLERGGAFVSLGRDFARDAFRIGIAAGRIEVRPRDMDLRPGFAPLVDQALDPKIAP